MKLFEGRTTNNRLICKVEFETPQELYNVLVEKGIISLEDGDPMDLARFGKATNKFDENIKEAFAKKYEEFDENYSGKSRNTYQDFMLQFPDLTDDEIMDVISDCDGNAYYQEIIDLEEEKEEE
jgi:t-SNARE complex subunit (syntaxin)